MKHDYITCDKVGCGKRIDDGRYWSILCTPHIPLKDLNTLVPKSTLDLCDSCYEDVCLFINNKENEVKDDQPTTDR